MVSRLHVCRWVVALSLLSCDGSRQVPPHVCLSGGASLVALTSAISPPFSGSLATASFVLCNGLKHIIAVTGVESTCSCESIMIAGHNVRPNRSLSESIPIPASSRVQIDVTFSAQPGDHLVSLRVFLDDSSVLSANLAYWGDMPISIDPSEHHLGALQIGRSYSVRSVIRCKDPSISALELSGSLNANLARIDSGTWELSAVLSPAQEGTMVVDCSVIDSARSARVCSMTVIGHVEESLRLSSYVVNFGRMAMRKRYERVLSVWKRYPEREIRAAVIETQGCGVISCSISDSRLDVEVEALERGRISGLIEVSCNEIRRLVRVVGYCGD